MLATLCFLIGVIGAKASIDMNFNKGVYIIAPMFLLISLLCLVGAVFVPSSRTAAAMYVVPTIVNNEGSRTLCNGIYDLAVEWMKELKPKTSNKNTNDQTEHKEGELK
jgi:hypothetical protein